MYSPGAHAEQFTCHTCRTLTKCARTFPLVLTLTQASLVAALIFVAPWRLSLASHARGRCWALPRIRNTAGFTKL